MDGDDYLDGDKNLEDLIPGEKRKAQAAIRLLPKAVRKHYTAHYSLGSLRGILSQSRRAGEFVGLACNGCNRWSDAGHDKGCPVAELARIARKTQRDGSRAS